MRKNRSFTYRDESGQKDSPGTAVIGELRGPGGSGSRTCLRPWPPHCPPPRRPQPLQSAPVVDLTFVVADDAADGYCSTGGRGPSQSATTS